MATAAEEVDTTEMSMESYPMISGCLGICLIITNYIFTCKNLTSEYGLKVDEVRLRAAFKFIGFKVVAYNNICAEEMKLILQTIGNEVGENDAAFVICVLSHGFLNKIYGVDGMFIDFHYDIVCNIGKCEKLQDKPIFIIDHTCQTRNPNEGQNPLTQEEVCKQYYSHIIIFATAAPGYPGVSPPSGSYAITILCDCIKEFHEKKNLLDIMNEAATRIYKKSKNAQPVVTHTLRKHLFLRTIKIELSSGIKRRLEEEKKIEEAQFHVELAEALQQANCIDDAIKHCSAAHYILKNFDTSHEEAKSVRVAKAHCHVKFAETFQQANSLDDAIKHYSTAHNILKILNFDNSHAEVKSVLVAEAECHVRLAERFKQTENYEGAITEYSTACTILKDNLGEFHKDTKSITEATAECNYSDGLAKIENKDYKKAEQRFDQAYKLYKKIYNDTKKRESKEKIRDKLKQTLEPLKELAQTQKILGNYDDAIKNMTEHNTDRQTVFEKTYTARLASKELTEFVIDIGIACFENCDFNKAETPFLIAQDENKHCQENKILILNFLGMIYIVKKIENAENTFEDGIKKIEIKLTPTQTKTKYVTKLKRAIAAIEKHFPNGHDLFSPMFSLSAMIYREQGLPQDAEEMLQKEADVLEKFFKGTLYNSKNAIRLRNLALVYIDKSLHIEAKKNLDEALEIQKHNFGDDHPQTVVINKLSEELEQLINQR